MQLKSAVAMTLTPQVGLQAARKRPAAVLVPPRACGGFADQPSGAAQRWRLLLLLLLLPLPALPLALRRGGSARWVSVLKVFD